MGAALLSHLDRVYNVQSCALSVGSKKCDILDVTQTTDQLGKTAAT
eukprot:CAMPEP_0182903502 /NCGR_PEP_ID=MMETSP0034_2-20130328/31335_1 /TAXON_ID=156128 /ORGANISM="Nephroselmis pyriformis, Strain CCMP717" /LENGTH=45 /DNA_ID= /DNA_START= /DNA_END= /DNA_ORIENTATION=